MSNILQFFPPDLALTLASNLTAQSDCQKVASECLDCRISVTHTNRLDLFIINKDKYFHFSEDPGSLKVIDHELRHSLAGL